LAPPERPQLLVDCDPGHDDAVALVVAAHYGDLVGITTVGGNAPLIDVTANALAVTHLFGIDAPVHAGAVRPLVAPPRHAPEIHGLGGFGGLDDLGAQLTPASDDAVGYLIETIRSTEGLWLVALGPLTNVALALRQAPDLADRLAGISFMGGSADGGNRTAAAEFNMLVDPEAGAAVVGSGIRLHMAGLDLTQQFPVDDTLAQDLSTIEGRGAQLLADLVRAYLDRVEAITGRRRGGLHDPCAVLAVTHPEVITSTLRAVEVELTGTHTRGMTVVDRRSVGPGGAGDGRAEPNVHHGHAIDAAAARKLVLDAIAARSVPVDADEARPKGNRP
jgi:inosine-uridine nucleoside N-ribohydrolase